MLEDSDHTSHKSFSSIIETGNGKLLDDFVREFEPRELSLAFSRLSGDEQAQVLSLLEPEFAAHLLQLLAEPVAAEALSEMEPSEAAEIIEELVSDEQVDLLSNLENEEAEAILAELPIEDAEELRARSEYDEYSAGGLMCSEFVAYSSELSVRALLDDLRKNRTTYNEYPVQYIYVLGARGALSGVLRLRDLLMCSEDESLSSIMIHNPTQVSAVADLDTLTGLFDSQSFFALPVTNERGALVGVVRREDVEEAKTDNARDIYLKSVGIIGGEEIRTMPLLGRSRKRLSWLSINIILNLMSASVIALYQDVLASVIALAVFLPIISDMSGCSGNQAVAVSIRELTLGLLRPYEILRVLWKEVSLGVINGLVLGALLAGAAILWQQDPLFGLVVGGALALNTVIAVVVGGSVPLFLKQANADPALASGPILTTLTDFCGFFLTLNLAQLILIS